MNFEPSADGLLLPVPDDPRHLSAMGYICELGIEYVPGDSYCWTCIPVLQFLWGRAWDELALRYVRALRPSALRVVRDFETSDGQTWRVTVHLEDDGKTIRDIRQEVEVDGPGTGYALSMEFKKRYGVIP